jgi:phosphatidylglycerol:prolipoprotein diacylglycerol transferase
VLLGLWIASRRVKRLGYDPDVVSQICVWIILGGFSGARLVHVFAYRWVDYQDNLLDILKLWEGGLSSYGGFAGAALASVWFLKRSPHKFWPYADSVAFGFIPGWALGRVGCFAIHDHPGSLSDFFLAVEMVVKPVGYDSPLIQARHDLGLYDGFLALAMAIVFFIADKKPRHNGFYIGWMCIMYAPARFLLDFVRATDLTVSDARYLHLTPAQYGSIILLLLGGWVIWKHRDTPQHSSS